MMKQMQEENKRMAQEKRDREKAWRDGQERTNQWEVAHVTTANFKQENLMTTVAHSAGFIYPPKAQ